ncbi:stress response protein NST1-like [Helianthus annuus]|uniref:stress response protein NST1-like n=1 Tax=Helianthus annuus TaxID=4232 RepID=UPI000B9073E9|nr:stress response protein NST1-like [Helianthus annuus]
MYPVADAFADPPTATEGAHIPNPRPLRSVSSARKEIIYLSSGESVGSSNGELSSWSDIFVGVLRDLGIDPEDKKKKPVRKKKVITLNPEVTSKGAGSSRATAGAADKGTLRLRQSNLEDYVIISDSFEGLSRIGEKKTGAGGSKSSGSVGSRNPDAGATPSSVAHEEEEEEAEEEEEPAAKLVSRKRNRSETTTGVSTAPKAGTVPLIGKQSSLRSLYRFSPEAKKKTPDKGVVYMEPSEPVQKRPKVTIKPFQAAGAESEKDKQAAETERAKAAEAEKRQAEEKKKAEEDKRKAEEERKKRAEEEKRKKVEEERKKVEEERKKKAEEERRKRASDKPSGDDVKRSGTVHIAGLDRPHHEKRKEPEFEKVVQSVKTTSCTKGSSSAALGKQGAPPYSPIGPRDTLGDIYYKSYTEESRGDALHQPPWGLKQKDTFLEFAPCRDWLLNSIPPGEVVRQRARTHSGLYHAYVVGEANTRAANHQIVCEWRTMVRERENWEKYRERILRRVDDFENRRLPLTKRRQSTKLTGSRSSGVVKALRIELAEVKAQLSGKAKDLIAKDVEIAELKRRLQEQVDKSESLEIDLEAEKGKAAFAE